MSNYNNLKSSINNNIYENQTQQITGTVLNAILNEMTNALGAGYQFAGVATVGMTPSEPDARIFYLAGEGIYTSFDGIQVPAGKLGILKWDNRWHLETIDGLGSGGANLTGYVTVASTDDLPDEGVATLGYLCGENLYLYVGEGGDTKDGKYQNCGSFRGPQGDSVQDVEQTQTSLENGGVNKIKFTLSNGISCEFQVRNGTTSSGLFPTLAALQAAYPSPVVGQYAFVGAGFPADIYVCTTAGTWTDSGEDYDGDNVDLTDYATKAEVTELEHEVDDLTEELGEINPHITGRIGVTASNDDVTPSSLPEYEDQYGVITLTLGTSGYLWLCLENDHFRITSGGVEIPMVYVKESGDLHCYVSAEKINAGTMMFRVESIHPIKSQGERVTITARDYTVTYGDAMPDFGYIADGEIVGTPAITCEAVQGSAAGTYEIVIARGTVEDDNCIYVNGTLTIQKAELIVTADNKQVAVGGAMPSFTMQYSGFVLGEDASDLTTAPTCTTNAEDTNTEGNYNIVPAGGVSGNYSFTYVDGVLTIGEPTIVTMLRADLFDSGSCGGQLDVNDSGKYKTNSNYYGILLDVRLYKGYKVRFTKGANVPVRYAVLKSATLTNNSAPSFSSTTGFTGLINRAWGTGETEFEITLPSDAAYMYVYTHNPEYPTTPMCPNIYILGVPPTAEYKNLTASLFTTEKSIGNDGTLVNSDSTIVSSYLDASEYTRILVASFIKNTLPEGVAKLSVNLAYYDGNKRFIKKDSYHAVPYTYSIPPSTAFVRVMVLQIDGDNNTLSGDTIRFDGNALQIEGVETS